jgi:hypothetical protein
MLFFHRFFLFFQSITAKSLSRYELGSSVPPANALGVSTDPLTSDKQVAFRDFKTRKNYAV